MVIIKCYIRYAPELPQPPLIAKVQVQLSQLEYSWMQLEREKVEELEHDPESMIGSVVFSKGGQMGGLTWNVEEQLQLHWEALTHGISYIINQSIAYYCYQGYKINSSSCQCTQDSLPMSVRRKYNCNCQPPQSILGRFGLQPWCRSWLVANSRTVVFVLRSKFANSHKHTKSCRTR